jgi:hypothetical protein
MEPNFMKRVLNTIASVFWASMVVIVLLIVGFFVLRQLNRVSLFQGVPSNVANLATPQG